MPILYVTQYFSFTPTLGVTFLTGYLTFTTWRYATKTTEDLLITGYVESGDEDDKDYLYRD